jgi:hypothetical protein
MHLYFCARVAYWNFVLQINRTCNSSIHWYIFPEICISWQVHRLCGGYTINTIGGEMGGVGLRVGTTLRVRPSQDHSIN